MDWINDNGRCAILKSITELSYVAMSNIEGDLYSRHATDVGTAVEN